MQLPTVVGSLRPWMGQCLQQAPQARRTRAASALPRLGVNEKEVLLSSVADIFLNIR